jgi:ribosome-binding factor A
MLVKPNFSQLRKQKTFEREISRILYKIIQENNLPSFSLSYCQLSSRGENLKIYLTFSYQVENQQKKLLKIINQQYISVVKKELAKSKKFSYIPNLFFLFDKELVEINTIEKIINQFNNLKNE